MCHSDAYASMTDAEKAEIDSRIDQLDKMMRVRRARVLREMDPAPRTPMAMLPNDHHPSWRCSCRDCLSAFPEVQAPMFAVHS